MAVWYRVDDDVCNLSSHSPVSIGFNILSARFSVILKYHFFHVCFMTLQNKFWCIRLWRKFKFKLKSVGSIFLRYVIMSCDASTHRHCICVYIRMCMCLYTCVYTVCVSLVYVRSEQYLYVIKTRRTRVYSKVESFRVFSEKMAVC